jgi:hypothetical protein
MVEVDGHEFRAKTQADDGHTDTSVCAHVIAPC